MMLSLRHPSTIVELQICLSALRFGLIEFERLAREHQSAWE